jgi:prolyl-tRNA synthetase
MIVIAVGKKNSEEFEFAEKVYNELKKRHVEVMFDDRQVSPGFKFKDAELIGIPIQIVIGKKTFQENKAEISLRKTGKKITVKKNELLEKVIELYEKELYDILD